MNSYNLNNIRTSGENEKCGKHQLHKLQNSTLYWVIQKLIQTDTIMQNLKVKLKREE